MKRQRPAPTPAASAAAAPAPAAAAAAAAAAAPRLPSVVSYTNKHRCLVFGSRGMTARYRHLLEDVRALVPHHKTESKLDSSELSMINEIAQAKSADTTLFFDVRKKKDLFLWASKTPSGPSVKFHVVNVHTMEELRLTGNALKGSRPVLSFDRAFDDEEGAPHLRLIRELLVHAFATPRGHPKSQPFHDRVLSFGWVDGKVWVRNYQVLDRTTDAKEAAKLLAAGEQPTVLVEIGPRFVLDVVRVFQGSFGGPTLWSSPTFVSPHQLRLELNRARGGKYGARQAANAAAVERRADAVLPKDPVASVFRDGLGGAPEMLAGGGGEKGEGEEEEEEEEEEEAPPPQAAKAKKAKVSDGAAGAAAGAAAAAAAAAPMVPAGKMRVSKAAKKAALK